MKADLVIYTHVLGVPGQYESVALMLSHKMDFKCCANRDGLCKSSHIKRNKYKMYVASYSNQYTEYKHVAILTRNYTTVCILSPISDLFTVIP